MSRGSVLLSRPSLSSRLEGLLLAAVATAGWPTFMQAMSLQATPTQLQPGLPVTAFVDVAVIPMDQERMLPKQTVLVQGGRIVALGPAAQVPVPPGVTQVDGQGKYLIPGLADMHIHLGANGGDSVSAERALFLLLAHGVTTVRNMDYRPNGMGQMGLDGAFLLGLRARAASGELLSPRIYTSGPWGPPQYIDGTEGYSDGNPPQLDSVAAYVTAYKAAGYDFIKIHDEDQAVAESVIVVAHRFGIPALGHLRDSTLAGYTSVEHLMGFDKIGDEPENVDMNLLDRLVTKTQRLGIWETPTLNVVEEGNMPSDKARLIISKMQAAGVGLLSGTDACASTTFGIPGPSLHRELGLLAAAGLTPYQALATSTRNVAVYFGTLKESGTVTVGKRADLVLLDGNPLMDITNTQHIAGVMVDGRWFSQETLAPRLARELEAAGASP